MNRFLSLSDSINTDPPSEQQARADAALPAYAVAAGMRMWRPGDPIPAHGCRLLLGVATWSLLDMQLLDDLARLAVAGDLQIDLFNVRDVPPGGSFESYIPGLNHIFQTPVAGLWEDGRPVAACQGQEARLAARRWVARQLGQPADVRQ